VTFVFVSGDLALDFAATLKWRRSEPEEQLSTSDDAARWAVEAGVLTAPPRVDATELRRLRALRETVYRLVCDGLAGRDHRPAELRALNRAAAGAPTRVALTAHGIRRTGDASTVATAVAVAAVELLAALDGTRVRECARPECTRLFVDRSRAGNRTWCGMEECGNRVKAASYRIRHSAAPR
jgi:predicted RNA-binding Zn ribbon-like protein